MHERHVEELPAMRIEGSIESLIDGVPSQSQGNLVRCIGFGRLAKEIARELVEDDDCSDVTAWVQQRHVRWRVLQRSPKVTEARTDRRIDFGPRAEPVIGPE